MNARNADLALTDATLGNGISLTPTYEPLSGRLQALTAFKPGLGTVMNLAYGYHPNGLVKSCTDQLTGRNETFGYDSLLRLTSRQLTLPTVGGTNPQPGVSNSVGYAYNTIGNLLEVDRNGSMIESNGYGDIAGQQPHSLTHHFDVPANLHTDYVYDTLGRQTSSTASRNVTYTTFDLPRTFKDSGGAGTLAYDAFGSRVRKSDSTGSTLYVDGLYERRQIGKIPTPATTQHVFHIVGSEGPVAQLTYTPAGPSTMTYLLQDHLGSASMELDANGAVTNSRYFDPFGQRINADGSKYGGVIGLIHDGFTGQEHDDLWGLINFRGRMYDPTLKRFLTADPVVSHPDFSQSWNAYSYVMNSPLNFTDPTGYQDGCGVFDDCPPPDSGPPLGPGPAGQGNTGGTPGTPSGGAYGSGVTQVGNPGAAGGTFGQGGSSSGGYAGKSDALGYRPPAQFWGDHGSGSELLRHDNAFGPFPDNRLADNSDLAKKRRKKIVVTQELIASGPSPSEEDIPVRMGAVLEDLTQIAKKRQALEAARGHIAHGLTIRAPDGTPLPRRRIGLKRVGKEYRWWVFDNWGTPLYPPSASNPPLHYIPHVLPALGLLWMFLYMDEK